MLITSAANNLNKAHVKYLESHLVEEARRIGKVALDNGNTPPRPSLSEAARANMENFLEYLLMVLPALRIDSFLANTRPKSAARISPLDSSAESAPPTFVLNTPKHGIEAAAVVNGRPANGTIEWKLISGKTYKEWEQEKLAQEVSTNE